jgi:putative FmdB family regulatory protein
VVIVIGEITDMRPATHSCGSSTRTGRSWAAPATVPGTSTTCPAATCLSATDPKATHRAHPVADGPWMTHNWHSEVTSASVGTSHRRTSVPTYQYACTECGHDFEVVQSFSDASLTECPVCAGRLRKVFNAVGIVFKGSGFYRTDSRNGAGKDGAKDASKDGAKDGSKDKAEKTAAADKPATAGKDGGSSTSAPASKPGSSSGNGSSGASGTSGSGSSPTATTSSKAGSAA